MISLNLKNIDCLKKYFKFDSGKEKISDIINKKEILKQIKTIILKKSSNKIMAEEIINNNSLYNESIIDAASELIENERFYNKYGKPLFWSNEQRLLCFKYNKKDPYKLAKYITNSLIKIFFKKYNDKNDISMFKEEFEKKEEFGKNLELCETYVKLEISESVFDQIVSEVIEILYHIELNRKNPKLYQFKSIYSSIDLPILECQEKMN